MWAAGIIGALGVLVLVGGYALLHSARVHAYLLRTAQAKASQALGSDVRIGDYALRWSGISPTVELYGLVVHGASPNVNPPLAQADSLRVGLTVSSLLHRTWFVNAIEIKRPIVRILADSKGQTNLPHPTPSESSTGNNFDIFSLGVRHLSLLQGDIYYNDQKTNLSADLHDLSVQVGFAAQEKRYSGTLSYRNGSAVLQGRPAMPHQLDARFSITPAQFDLEEAHLKSGGSRLDLQATVHDYSRPIVQGKYEAVLNATELRRIAKNSSVPSGVIFLTGAIDYRNDPARSPLASAKLDGTLRSSSLTAAQQGRSLRVERLSANYSLLNGKARISALHANVLGGELTGELTIGDVANAANAKLSASLKHASASAVHEFAAPAVQSNVRLSGTLSLSTQAAWRKSLADLSANAQLRIAAGMQPTNGRPNIPINGTIAAHYSGATKAVTILEPSSVRTAQSSVSIAGTVGNTNSLQVHVQSGDLNEFEQIADAFHAGAAPLNLRGQGSITATVTGSIQSPQVHGQIALSDVRLRDTAWKSLRAQFSGSQDSVSVQQGELVPASRGRIAFQLNARLQQWAFVPGSSFQAGLHATDLDAKQLALLAGSTTPVSGVLAVNVDAHGTGASPLGQGTVRLTKAQIAGEPIRSLDVDLQANGQTVAAQAHLDMTAGSARADLRYEPKQQSYDVQIHSSGIKVQQLQNVKGKSAALAGEVLIDVSGRGTLQDPNLQATVRIPQLKVRDQIISDVKLNAGVANHLANFTLDSDAVGTHAAARGSIRLAGNFPAEISADTQAIQFQPLLAMYAPAMAPDISGQTELHARLRGPLKRIDQLEAHVEIPQLTLNYKNAIKLGAAGPIHADYNGGVLDVQRSSIRGNGTDLTFQAHVPTAKDAPASVLLQGNVDLQIAKLFSPDINSSGQVQFDIDSYGRRSDPNIQGQVRIVNATFSQAGTPLGLSDGNGTLTLTRDRLNVTEFKGRVGGGNVTASGGLVYRPQLRADFALKAEGVRILYAQSVRATVDSDIALTGQYDNALLHGQVNIDQLSFTSGFDLTTFAGQLGGDDVTPVWTGGIGDNLHLDISLQTPGGLNLSSRDLSLAGSADLHVRGSASQPVVLGRANLTDGELIFNGNRYLVQRGTIDFRNPTRTEPIVDMSVNTTIQQYDIQAHIWGPADHLATNYSSDPSLPPSDIINLIAFGKTAEAQAANPSPPGMLGAQSLVASQVSSQVTSRISKLAGISQLSVDPVLGSSQQSPGARVNVQQRVTGKIFVTFSTDITATQQEVIQVEYRANRRTSVKAVRDQNGGFSLQTSFRKEW